MITDYINTCLAKNGFAYGTNDCCTFMADWLVSCGWPDPMADRRGTYHNEKEFRTAIASEGGLIAACKKRFSDIGLQEVDIPKDGDVCLVRSPVKSPVGIIWSATGSICITDKLKAVITPDLGIVMVNAGVIKAWSVNNA